MVEVISDFLASVSEQFVAISNVLCCVLEESLVICQMVLNQAYPI